MHIWLVLILQSIFECIFVTKRYCHSSNDVICLCNRIVTMMTWARCYLHMLTKGPNLLGLNVKCLAHMHTRQCRGQLVMTCFNGHAMRLIVTKTSVMALCVPSQMLLGKNTCRMALPVTAQMITNRWTKNRACGCHDCCMPCLKLRADNDYLLLNSFCFWSWEEKVIF